MFVIQLCVKIHVLVMLRLRANVLPFCSTVSFFLPACMSVCPSVSLDGWLLFLGGFCLCMACQPGRVSDDASILELSSGEREREGEIERLNQTMSEPCLMPQINPNNLHGHDESVAMGPAGTLANAGSYSEAEHFKDSVDSGVKQDINKQSMHGKKRAFCVPLG